MNDSPGQEAVDAVVTDAREEILGRIARALADVPEGERPDDVAVAQAYRRTSDGPHVDRFEERVRDYGATVRRTRAEAVAEALADGCRELGIERAAVAPDLPPAWRPAGVELIQDDNLSTHELDRLNSAITGCATAIADTGTLVLDGQGRSGRRALTLVVDHHICVVEEEQIVGLVPEAIARVAPAVVEGGRPITLVSGPSATSDIELSRVEGVHGPRHLMVVIVSG